MPASEDLTQPDEAPAAPTADEPMADVDANDAAEPMEE